MRHNIALACRRTVIDPERRTPQLDPPAALSKPRGSLADPAGGLVNTMFPVPGFWNISSCSLRNGFGGLYMLRARAAAAAFQTSAINGLDKSRIRAGVFTEATAASD